MKTIIKIEYNELAKSVVANTKLEVELEGTEEHSESYKELPQLLLQRSKELFDDAHSYAKKKTGEKMLGGK